MKPICQHYNIHSLNSLATRSKPDVFSVEKITYSLFCTKLFAIVQLDNALKPYNNDLNSLKAQIIVWTKE